jgi:molecular chaperone GrpE
MNTEDNNPSNTPSQNPNNTEDDNIVNLDGMNGEPSLEITPEALIENLEKELVEARERTMRALADAENTRKRAAKDRDDAGKYAVAGFARDLLDFGDNFKRAMDAMPEDTPSAVADGLTAMQSELLSTFDRHGIKKIEPLDANFHEVMFETPIEGKKAGTIIQVIEAGYVLNGRLLRAAKVGIAKASDNTPPPENSGIDTQA